MSGMFCKLVETFHVVSNARPAYTLRDELIHVLAQQYSCFDR